MRVAGDDAIAALAAEGKRSRYPASQDPRSQRGLIFPDLRPSFTFEPGSRIFTIGSCFARNIEEHLAAEGHDIPTLRFSAPEHEWPALRRNGMMNEYNPGTISQRIERAFSGEPAPESTIVEHEAGWVDLLLPSTAAAASYERVVERRAEIDAVYRELPTAAAVIVTLGLIEAWLDTTTGAYLNRIPPRDALGDGRYELVVMDADSALALLGEAFRLFSERGIRTLITVSPVPLNATFTREDAVVANSLSKAVLRVCAHRLSQMPTVDYFPSYEIVMSGGLACFDDDQVHVRDDVVGDVVRHMLEAYTDRPRDS